MPDKFTGEVVTMLALGITQVVQLEEESPGKHPKIEPRPAP
jgi:hypothetical protein